MTPACLFAALARDPNKRANRSTCTCIHAARNHSHEAVLVPFEVLQDFSGMRNFADNLGCAGDDDIDCEQVLGGLMGSQECTNLQSASMKGVTSPPE